MADGKGFDLGALLKNVSAADTGKEQIEYIPLDLIDPDPDNFYSLEGLNELAGNIETIGLQQPLRLRPAPGGRYTVLSGHRRRAACLLIRDGGSNLFDQGVPCIVERDLNSPAVVKLKLLMANSDTRKMTSADQNRQAAELEDVLRQLEDEGFQFPGRIRDWVAELSGLSRSRLARLKVIREKLAPDIKRLYYDTGKLDETAAYEMARLDLDTQRWAADVWTQSHGGSFPMMGSRWPGEFAKHRQKVAEQTCRRTGGGGSCMWQREIMEHLYRKGYADYCCEGCCEKCQNMVNCRHVCPRMMGIQVKRRAEKREAQKDEKAREAAVKEQRVREIELFWFRFGQAMLRAGTDENALMEAVGCDRYTRPLFHWGLSAEQRDALLDGSATDTRPDAYLPFDRGMDLEQGRRLVKLADALGCSLDYLLRRTEVPEVNTGEAVSTADTSAPAWQTGQPTQPGCYAVRFKVGPDAPGEVQSFSRWDGWCWRGIRSGKAVDGMIAVGWYKIPEVT